MEPHGNAEDAENDVNLPSDVDEGWGDEVTQRLRLVSFCDSIDGAKLVTKLKAQLAEVARAVALPRTRLGKISELRKKVNIFLVCKMMHHHEAMSDTTTYTCLIARLRCVGVSHYRELHRFDEEKLLSIVARIRYKTLLQ